MCTYLRGTTMAIVWLCVIPLTRAGQNIVVVLDDSGSMSSSMRGTRVQKMEAAKDALVTVLGDLPEDTRVGVLVMNRSQDPWIVPLDRLDRDQTAAAIRRIVPRGGTPLGAYIKIGADALMELRKQQRYGDYRLLIVTDGEAEDPYRVGAIVPAIMARGVTIDVIGVDMAGEHTLARHVHSYRRADDPRGLQQAISQVFAESTADDRGSADAGESDFEIIAPLPDAFAAAAVSALAEANNDEIVPASQSTYVPTVEVVKSVAMAAIIVGTVCLFVFIIVSVFVLRLILKSRMK